MKTGRIGRPLGAGRADRGSLRSRLGSAARRALRFSGGRRPPTGERRVHPGASAPPLASGAPEARDRRRGPPGAPRARLAPRLARSGRRVVRASELAWRRGPGPAGASPCTCSTGRGPGRPALATSPGGALAAVCRGRPRRGLWASVR